MTDKIDAWWFAASDRLPHGDNRKIIIGKSHSISGDIILCHALHASRDPYDALHFAPGPFLYKVQCWGDVVETPNKLGARHRKYLAMRNATDMLCRYAREQALSVIDNWNAPEVVRRYLETGDITLRSEAHSEALRAERSTMSDHVATSYAAICAARCATECDATIATVRNMDMSAVCNAVQFAIMSISPNVQSPWATDARTKARNAARIRFGEMVIDLFRDAE